MSLLSSIGSVRRLADEETDHNMLQDLQLAAELGKTLLERNKELENIIKLHQSTVEEQAQEIEYMKKQTAALREVNDSRLKIYEQLEVSIQDLERANHRLVIENTSDKKLIKSQCSTIETLEARCEELQKKIDELYEQHENRLRQQTTSQSKNTAQTQTALWKASVTPGGGTQENATKPEEEMTELLRQLQEARNQRAREHKKAADLGQQLANLLQENTALEEQIAILRSKAQDVKNLQEEINALEEVRRGHLCGRCLRGMETKTHDEISVMLDHEDCDVMSMAESLISDSQRDTESLTQGRLARIIMKSKAKRETKEFRSSLWTTIACTIWKAPSLIFVFFHTIWYIKNECVMPLLLKPFRIPFFILKKIFTIRERVKFL